ncbi:hypothetical protein CL647_02800 [bacterium]|nr:hypothetical protein [bacterium]
MIELQPKPKKLKTHSFKKSWLIPHTDKECWNILNKMETFTESQVFPYKVEFIDKKKPPSFNQGVWTNHHGPLLNLCGQIGKMIKYSYRDLNYSYGSYVVSFRLIRPTRLQFFLEKKNNETIITVQLDSYVSAWLQKTWSLFQAIFWSNFGKSISKKIKQKK